MVGLEHIYKYLKIWQKKINEMLYVKKQATNFYTKGREESTKKVSNMFSVVSIWVLY